MKKIPLLLTLILLPFLIYTQNNIWEINVNLGSSTLLLKNDPVDYEYLGIGPLESIEDLTYNIGSNVGIQLVPKLYFHAGLNFMQLKAKEEAVISWDFGNPDDEGEIVYMFSYNSYFFSSPVFLKFKHKRLGLYGGGQVLFYLKGKTEYKVTFDEETFRSEEDNSWNSDLELKRLSYGYLLGVSYDFTTTFGIKAEVFKGLSNVAIHENTIFQSTENYTRHAEYFTIGIYYIYQ